MTSTVAFAAAVRAISESARLHGYEVPLFVSRPRGRAAPRSIRRGPRGATVSVVTRDRPWNDVLGDLVQGVVVVNGLTSTDATRCRALLWAAATDDPVRAA